VPVPDDFEAWFRLLETPGLGRGGARRLLASCGSPEAALNARPATLRTLVGADVAQALAGTPPDFDAHLAAAKRWLAGGERRGVITLGAPEYPARLLQTADPPLLLYVDGDVGRLGGRALAIVGSRHPTPQGADNARAFAAALSAQGWVIVSGLALGIDAAAHEGALDGAAGTVAVLGTGLDPIYPRANTRLAQRIAAQGLLLSEMPPGTPALAERFPQRNRIIAGLTEGTLVVEAALQSGSLITARQAAEAGREVFAIPGSIHSPQSKGCHALLKQGAKLVESAADILDELLGTRPLAPAASIEVSDRSDEDPVLAALGHDPVTLDALLARTGWPTAEITARLLELELAGRVARLPGGLYQRRGAA
jgi:DNA processing protein